ncbi:hypothetical protein ALP84_200112 [Pseudomonas cichorii]|uniref:Uncharacterized protein n=1 Tax=Pseudomonas cichorii TaxID=36746 RepID=A0A3M4VZY8_PSECI|nr:hypothetical protein ALP84_200112 [Pseudomonas cichorii]
MSATQQCVIQTIREYSSAVHPSRVCFPVGGLVLAMATDGTQIIIWRVVQALGVCANVVLARAMVRDLYEGREAVQKMSTLMTIMAIAPLAGPTLGGQILQFCLRRLDTNREHLDRLGRANVDDLRLPALRRCDRTIALGFCCCSLLRKNRPSDSSSPRISHAYS